MEFAVEAQKLLSVSLEGSVGYNNFLNIKSLSVKVDDKLIINNLNLRC